MPWSSAGLSGSAHLFEGSHPQNWWLFGCLVRSFCWATLSVIKQTKRPFLKRSPRDIASGNVFSADFFLKKEIACLTHDCTIVCIFDLLSFSCACHVCTLRIALRGAFQHGWLRSAWCLLLYVVCLDRRSGKLFDGIGTRAIIYTHCCYVVCLACISPKLYKTASAKTEIRLAWVKISESCSLLSPQNGLSFR